jgi:hypothetical protein
MERLGDSVERELSRFGSAGTMAALVRAWPATVGPDVARNAWPARLTSAGVLHVHTSSSLWAFELSQLAADIRARLAEALAEGAPATLRFAPGPLPEATPEPAGDVLRALPDPSSEDVAEAGRLAAEIGDEELRERVAEAAARSLQRARSGRSF